jgi:hypothetical protein
VLAFQHLLAHLAAEHTAPAEPPSAPLA